MENASKAIIIAGSVIILLMVVGLGMFVYNKASSSVSVVDTQLDTMIVQEYNSQYTKYEKAYVTGVEVKECILEVLHNNANTKNDAVFVTGVEVHNADRVLKYVDITVAVTGVKRALPNDYPLSSISNASRYTTDIIVGDDGLVQNIIFKIK